MKKTAVDQEKGFKTLRIFQVEKTLTSRRTSQNNSKQTTPFKQVCLPYESEERQQDTQSD
jgi:hypothetical protein